MLEYATALKLGVIDLAMDRPPRNTRTAARGELTRNLRGMGVPYIINGFSLHIDGKDLLSMPDPFKTYTSEAKHDLRQ